MATPAKRSVGAKRASGAKRSVGPKRYSPSLAAKICERLAQGESLSAVCRDKAMPSMSAVMDWLCKRPAFRERYARARELQADALFDEILAIADEASEGAASGETAQRSRLRVETRKWIVARLAPKKYGDKLITGDGEAPARRPVTIQVITGVPRAGD